MKIGILQTGYLPLDLNQKYSEYPQMFMDFLDGHGFTWEVYPVLENHFPETIEDCDGWLITGSKHGAYDDLVWIAPLEDFIRQAYAADIPVAGICFGHQIMAQALGGKVEKFGGLWGAGKQTYNAGDSTISLMAMHQDQVIEKPTDASVIASSDFCKYAGLAYKGRALSYQPHPEFSTEFTRDLIEARIGQSIPQDQGEKALTDIYGELNRHQISQELVDFFKPLASS